jgi:hypothetical protein
MSQRFFSQNSLARSGLRRLNGMTSSAIFPPEASVPRTPVPTTVGAAVTSVTPPQSNLGGAPALRFDATTNSKITLPGAGAFWGATAAGSTDGGLNQKLRFGNLGQFTLEFWINFNSAAGQQGLFEFGTGGLFVGFNGLSQVYFGVTNVSYYFTNTLAVTVNTWHHIAFCRRRDGANNKLAYFLNGTFIAEKADANQNWTGNTADPFIGQAIGSANFNGWLQDFRISNIARYPPNENFPVPTSNLINDGNTVFLLSGSSPIEDNAS